MDIYGRYDFLSLFGHSKISNLGIYSNHLLCCCSVTPSCATLCDCMDYNTSGFSVLHHLLELAQTHVHWIGDGIQSSRSLPSLSPPAFNPSHLLTFTNCFFLPGSASSGQTISNYINCCSSRNNCCSHEIKRCSLLGRKMMTNLDSILKSRDILCQQMSV